MKVIGAPRKYSREILRRVRYSSSTSVALSREMGIPARTIRHMRTHQYKKPAP